MSTDEVAETTGRVAFTPTNGAEALFNVPVAQSGPRMSDMLHEKSDRQIQDEMAKADERFPVKTEMEGPNPAIDIRIEQNPDDGKPFLVTFPEKVKGEDGSEIEVRRSLAFIVADPSKGFDKLPEDTLKALKARMVGSLNTLLDTGTLRYQGKTLPVGEGETRPDYDEMLAADPDGLADMMVIEQLSMKPKALIARYKPDFTPYERQQVLAAAKSVEARMSQTVNREVAERVKADHPDIYARVRKEVFMEDLGFDAAERVTQDDEKALNKVRTDVRNRVLGKEISDFLRAYNKAKKEKSLSFQIAASNDDESTRKTAVRRLEGEILGQMDGFFPPDQALEADYYESQLPTRNGDRIILSQRTQLSTDGTKRTDVRVAHGLDTVKREIRGSEKVVLASEFDLESARIRREANIVNALTALKLAGSDPIKQGELADKMMKTLKDSKKGKTIA